MWNTQNQPQGNGQFQRNNVNVSTNVRTFTSEKTQLVVSFWNTAISLKINRATGVDPYGNPTFDRSFNSAGGSVLGQSALTAEKVKTMVLAFREKVLPTYEKVIAGVEPCPDNLSVSVETGRAEKRNCIVLGIRKAEVPGGVNFFFAICSGLTAENTVAEENVFEHVFAKQPIKENYNYKTGMTDNTFYVEADFWNFFGILENSSMIPVEYHMSKYRAQLSKNGSLANGNNNNFAALQSQAANNFTTGYSAPAAPATSGGVGFGMQDALPFN